jgi:hypothetical protein
MKLPLLSMLTISVLFAASAQAQTAGSGTLTGTQRLKASGCGKDSAPVSVAMSLAGDGAWTATAGDDDFAGTSTTSGRTASLAFDGASTALLDSALEILVSGLCDDDVSINSISVTTARLKVNKRQTSAKLRVKVVGTGTSSEGSGTGTYRIKASGPWTPAS